MPSQRLAYIGTGGRALSFVEPVVTTYRGQHEVVAFLDNSPTRMAYYNELLASRWQFPAVPTYAPADFDRPVPLAVAQAWACAR